MDLPSNWEDLASDELPALLRSGAPDLGIVRVLIEDAEAAVG